MSTGQGTTHTEHTAPSESAHAQTHVHSADDTPPSLTPASSPAQSPLPDNSQITSKVLPTNTLTTNMNSIFQPITTITKFDGTSKISPSTPFPDTESYVLSTKPNIDKNSNNFQTKCMQHVQRIDQSVSEVFRLFRSINKSDANPWTVFKKRYSMLIPRNASAWLQFHKLMMKPKTLSHPDLGLLEADIRTAFTDFMIVLSKDNHHTNLHAALVPMQEKYLSFLTMYFNE